MDDTARRASVLPGRTQEHMLVNAERERDRRGLDDVFIVDCDSHLYETNSFPEIVRRVRNRNIRRPLETMSAEYIQGFMIPQSIGDRSVGGRLPISQMQHVIDASDMHPIAATTLHSMDSMGIDYTILFPTPMLNLGLTPQIEIEIELGHAFNSWLLDDVLPCSDRLLTMPYLPLGDPDACMQYIEDFAGRAGVVGFMITAVRYEPFHRNQYMKVFAALNERSMPIAFHSGPNWFDRPFTILGRFLGVHALGFPFYAMTHLTNVVLSGLPERFPNIKWIYMEAGEAWVPFCIARLDNEYKQRSAEAPLLQRLPSEYIRDMYFTTQPFEEHENSAHTRAMIDIMNGTQSLLYASDYPHPDFDTPAIIWDQRCLDEREKRAILGDNARALFDLPGRVAVPGGSPARAS
ncbi:MAG: amidohydrolase family protein [Solirubrobacteraceae bacterium]|nr:amidohydrolase family protein [Solirubrobacteraceae bacterium]